MTLVILIVGGFTALYLWTMKKFTYFENKGIVQDPPRFPLGSSPTQRVLTGKLNFIVSLNDLYNKHRDQKIVGHYGFLGKPLLMIKDIDYIKDITIKDFDAFVDRRSFVGENTKYLSEMLFALKGDKWRTMRTIASPTFTSGKLKSMMPLMNKAGKNLQTHLNKFAKSGKELELKKVMSLYTLETTASCGFGIDIDAFNDPEGSFNDMVRCHGH